MRHWTDTTNWTSELQIAYLYHPESLPYGRIYSIYCALFTVYSVSYVVDRSQVSTIIAQENMIYAPIDKGTETK